MHKKTVTMRWSPPEAASRCREVRLRKAWQDDTDCVQRHNHGKIAAAP